MLEAANTGLHPSDVSTVLAEKYGVTERNDTKIYRKRK